MRFGGSYSMAPKESNVKIILPIPVYHKMLAYAQASEGEISGFGRTRTETKRGKTVVTITDVRIFKQTVTEAHTELDKDGLAKFIVELIKLGEKPQRWNLWWHSHHDFSVFFSSVDTGTIDALSKNSRLYSICINKKGELTGRVDNRGKELGDADVIVDRFINPKLIASCRKEVKDKVKFEKFATTLSQKEAQKLVQYVDADSPFRRTVDDPIQERINYYGGW